MKQTKIYHLIRVILAALIGIGCGAVMLWAEPYADEFFDILLVFIGLLGILFNVPQLLSSIAGILKNKKWEWLSFLVSVLAILIGVAFLLLSRDEKIIPPLLIAYALFLPILRISLVAQKAHQAKREAPKLPVVGLLLALCFFEIEDVLFKICGFALIGFSVLYLLYSLLVMKWRFEVLEEQLEEERTEEE